VQSHTKKPQLIFEGKQFKLFSFDFFYN